MKLTVSSVLCMIFVVLKLTHYIDWPWWWVTAPVWLPATIGGVLWTIYIIGHTYKMKHDPAYAARQALREYHKALTGKDL